MKRNCYTERTFMTSKNRGLFFMLKNKEIKVMDIKKLMEMVLANEEIQDIPLIFVLAVMNSVVEAISSGECLYKTEFD